MADLLQNTLTGTTPLPPTPTGLQVPTLTGNNKTDINNLSAAQKQPNQIMDFQKVMQLTSQQAYKDRQASEMETTSKQFDPTKVSGGTFASIIGNLEQNRGADVSKIYGSTMEAYKFAQQQITERLQYLQELEEQRRQFEQEMKLKKEELKRLKKNDKDAYKFAKGEYEMKKTDWERTYAKELAKANTSYGQAQMYPNWSLYSA